MSIRLPRDMQPPISCRLGTPHIWFLIHFLKSPKISFQLVSMKSSNPPPAKLARIQPPKTTSPQVTTRPSARSAPKARCEASNWRTWRCWVIPRHLAGSGNLEHQDYPCRNPNRKWSMILHWIHSAKIIYYPATNTVCSNRKMGPSNEGDMVFWWSWPSCVGVRFRGRRVHFDLLLPVSCCKSNPNHHQISSQDFHNIYNSNGCFLFPNSRIFRCFFSPQCSST